MKRFITSTLILGFFVPLISSAPIPGNMATQSYPQPALYPQVISKAPVIGKAPIIGKSPVIAGGMAPYRPIVQTGKGPIVNQAISKAPIMSPVISKAPIISKTAPYQNTAFGKAPLSPVTALARKRICTARRKYYGPPPVLPMKGAVLPYNNGKQPILPGYAPISKGLPMPISKGLPIPISKGLPINKSPYISPGLAAPMKGAILPSIQRNPYPIQTKQPYIAPGFAPLPLPISKIPVPIGKAPYIQPGLAPLPLPGYQSKGIIAPGMVIPSSKVPIIQPGIGLRQPYQTGLIQPGFIAPIGKPGILPGIVPIGKPALIQPGLSPILPIGKQPYIAPGFAPLPLPGYQSKGAISPGLIIPSSKMPIIQPGLVAPVGKPGFLPGIVPIGKQPRIAPGGFAAPINQGIVPISKGFNAYPKGI